MSDIRRFFNKNFVKKRKLDDTNDSQPTTTVSSPSPSTSHDQDTIGPENTTDKTFLNVHLNRLDIGMYTDSTILVDEELRLKLLEEPWTPNQTYDFKKDGNSEAKRDKRLFRLEWLKTYPWLAYSAIAKGPFCRVCVLFRPLVHRGLQGQFILVSNIINSMKLHNLMLSPSGTSMQQLLPYIFKM